MSAKLIGRSSDLGAGVSLQPSQRRSERRPFRRRVMPRFFVDQQAMEADSLLFLMLCRIISELCPGGLKDKVAVSGAADTGSIPVRDAKKPLKLEEASAVFYSRSRPRRRSVRSAGFPGRTAGMMPPAHQEDLFFVGNFQNGFAYGLFDRFIRFRFD